MSESTITAAGDFCAGGQKVKIIDSTIVGAQIAGISAEGAKVIGTSISGSGDGIRQLSVGTLRLLDSEVNNNSGDGVVCDDTCVTRGLADSRQQRHGSASVAARSTRVRSNVQQNGRTGQRWSPAIRERFSCGTRAQRETGRTPNAGSRLRVPISPRIERRTWLGRRLATQATTRAPVFRALLGASAR
jgi:hypothetical protein